MHDDIDAEVDRVLIDRRAPGVVDDRLDTVFTGDLRDRLKVL